MDRLIVTDEQANKRLDQVLAESYSQYSRSKLQDWLQAGLISLDGSLNCKGSRPVKTGSIIEVNKPAIDQLKSITEDYIPTNIPLDIIYQDNDIIVINKPINLVVHPAAGNWTGTLLHGLLYHFPELSSVPRAGIVHRLDKDTSGLMVVARSLAAHHGLIKQLQARQVVRKYTALVNGHLITGGVVNANIGRSLNNRLKMAVVDNYVVNLDEDGYELDEDHTNRSKEAITHYKILKKFPKHTLLELKLETGRTHQIRVHMAHIGYSIVGDRLYGRSYAAPKNCSEEEFTTWNSFKRQALAATELGFLHPASGEAVSWKINIPNDMQNLLNILNKS
jgi:23S rRNA pseudouridine1911/1915/1917 synthase